MTSAGTWGTDPRAELETKLNEHPDAKAVFVIGPTYYGVAPNIAGLAKICHRRGVPLVVDEAWGAHFPFHPDMPTPAIRQGADLAVVSVHKTLAGLEQASIIMRKGELIAPDRLNLSYDLHETTSPSSLILTSIDATRRQFAQEGEKLVQNTLDLAHEARRKLGAINGVEVMGKEVLDGDAAFALD